MGRQPEPLTHEQRIALLRGAYNAIDGLWFMAVEGRFGNSAAREMDEQVWRAWGRVVAKRLARDVGLPPGDVDGLEAALRLWFELEGYDFELRRIPRRGQRGDAKATDALEFTVRRCPWWEAMYRTGRQQAVDCAVVELGFMEGLGERLSTRWRVRVDRALPHGDGGCRMRLWLEGD